MTFRFLFVLMLLKTLSGLAATGSADTARTEFETGNYSAAVKTATAALSQTPEDASLHFWALRSYYELQDYGSQCCHASEHGNRETPSGHDLIVATKIRVRHL